MEVQIHFILIGQTGVGKTSVRKHLKNEPIDENESPTIVMEPEYLYRESMEVGPFKHIKDALTTGPSKVFLTMWDTGGQPIFQDLLPCFARFKSMYGVVFRLCDIENFDEKPEIRPCTKYDEPAESVFTNEEIVYRNLAYVLAYSSDKLEPGNDQSQKNDCFPAAIILGTFRDQMQNSDLAHKKGMAEEKFRKFILDNKLSYESEPGRIIEIDNTASGKSSADEGIVSLRKRISHCAEKSRSKISFEWSRYKAELQRLCYTDYINLGIIPLIEALRIGKEECKVSNPKAALIYFHELGVFMWYHMSIRESMKNYVVIDPKTLIDVLSKLLCLNLDKFPANKHILSRGIVTSTYFANLLQRKASKIDDSWFMAFLEENHLSVKVYIPEMEHCYFLPSLLPIKAYYVNDQESSTVSPLYIVPHSGYIATGMFPRLLTALAGVNSKRGSTSWRIPLNDPDDAVLREVCRNQFEFLVNDSVHVILSEFAKHIRVDCLPLKSSGVSKAEIADLCFHIVSTLDVQLQRIVPQWMKKGDYKFTFRCENDACSRQELHFFTDQDIIFKSNYKNVKCLYREKSSLEDSHLMWNCKRMISDNSKLL